MLQILKSEFFRYRTWSIGFMIVHLLYWTVHHIYMGSSAHSPIFDVAINSANSLTGVVVLSAFLFGVLQMYLHKRVSHWTWLIQRPIPMSHIFTGLAGAAVLHLVLAMFTPWLVMTLYVDLFTETLVDLRHYLFGCYLLSMGVATWLCGSFTVLSPSKGAFLVTGLVMFIVGHTPQTMNHPPRYMLVFFLLSLVVMAWLFYLNLKAFKPDLTSRETGAATVFLTALPMQITLMSVVFIGFTLLYHLVIQFHPNNPQKNPGEETESYFRMLSIHDRILYLLKNDETDQALYLKSQTKLGDVGYSTVIPAAYPLRGQMLVYDQSFKLEDTEGESLWYFSHDLMLMKGVNVRTREVVGWLGAGGFQDSAEDFTDEERFQSIPLVVDNDLLQFRRKLVRVNFEDRLLEVKHEVSGDETYYAVTQINAEHITLASNQSLYIFEKELFRDEPGLVEPEHVVAHPRPVKSLSHINMVRLVDGFLLLYSNDYFYGGGRPGAALVRTRMGGAHEVIVEKEFTTFVDPAFIRYQNMSASPFLNTLIQEYIWAALEPGQRTHHRVRLTEAKMSPALKTTYILIALLSGLITYLLARRRGVKGMMLPGWTVVNLVVGIPGLISFFLLTEKEIKPLV